MRTVPARVQRDPTDTALAAALDVDTGSQQERVAVYLREQGVGGATDQEMQRVLGIQRARTRRQALCEQGLVHDSGRRRETESGKTAIVWVWSAATESRVIESTGRVITRTPRAVLAPRHVAPDEKSLKRHEPKSRRRRASSKPAESTPTRRQRTPEETAAKREAWLAKQEETARANARR